MNNYKSKKFKTNQGFSLLEVILIVAIFLVLAASSTSLVVTKTSEEDLDVKAREVVDIIARARNYAMTGYFGDAWGIKVLDADSVCVDTGTGDCILLFKGSDYSARNSGYDELVNFDSGVYIESAEENEFYFNKISGWLTTTTDKQTIILKSNFGEQKTVTTTAVGLVFYGD